MTFESHNFKTVAKYDFFLILRDFLFIMFFHIFFNLGKLGNLYKIFFFT
jgi:hypothetical protein